MRTATGFNTQVRIVATLISKVYMISDEEFRDIVASSTTYSECLRKIGLTTGGSCSRTVLKRRIEELNCPINHFLSHIPNKNMRQYSLEEILVENSTYTSRQRLKQRLLAAGLLKYECSECGLSSWRNKPISLQLEHRNGVNNDNRFENLILLCPNCHSQTPTYAGRNTRATHQARALNHPKTLKIPREKKTKPPKKPYIRQRKVERPDKESLYNLLLTTPFLRVGKMYGVSDKAIVKWCKSCGIPSKASEYKQLKQQKINAE